MQKTETVAATLTAGAGAALLPHDQRDRHHTGEREVIRPCEPAGSPVLPAAEDLRAPVDDSDDVEEAQGRAAEYEAVARACVEAEHDMAALEAHADDPEERMRLREGRRELQAAARWRAT